MDESPRVPSSKASLLRGFRRSRGAGVRLVGLRASDARERGSLAGGRSEQAPACHRGDRQARRLLRGGAWPERRRIAWTGKKKGGSIGRAVRSVGVGEEHDGRLVADGDGEVAQVADVDRALAGGDAGDGDTERHFAR